MQFDNQYCTILVEKPYCACTMLSTIVCVWETTLVHHPIVPITAVFLREVNLCVLNACAAVLLVLLVLGHK